MRYVPQDAWILKYFPMEMNFFITRTEKYKEASQAYSKKWGRRPSGGPEEGEEWDHSCQV